MLCSVVLTQLAVVPIMVGVMMACYGDMGSFGLMGVAVTVLCVIMSGMKNVLSGEMLTGDIKAREEPGGCGPSFSPGLSWWLVVDALACAWFCKGGRDVMTCATHTLRARKARIGVVEAGSAGTRGLSILSHCMVLVLMCPGQFLLAWRGLCWVVLHCFVFGASVCLSVSAAVRVKKLLSLFRRGLPDLICLLPASPWFVTSDAGLPFMCV